MKKTIIFSVFFLTVLCGCFSQSSPNDRRIIGSYTTSPDGSGRTWTFNTNGTFSRDDVVGVYGATDSKLVVRINDGTIYYNYSVSSDGRTIILESISLPTSSSSSLYDSFTGRHWLTKK